MINLDGWVKLHRVLLEKPIWKVSTPQQKTIFITLLLMANHEESEWEWQGNKFKVHPGQKITSLENIAKEAGKGISVQNVRTALDKFEKYGFLTNQSTKTGRLITIENWTSYQLKENNQQSNEQRPNKEVTTNKNDKNLNNTIIPISISKISDSELKAKYEEREKRAREFMSKNHKKMEG